ncbi:unnamed protein product [Closterium sp. NIES-53]
MSLSSYAKAVRQRTAPHSSFPPTMDPFQTLHLDVWGPSPLLGPCQERYFLIVVDDYSRYTTVFPLRRKADVLTVLEPWLLARGGAQGLYGLRLQSDRGGCPDLQCHAGAPQFLWPQAVRYVAHQLNLWPSDARPRVSSVSLWTGKLVIPIAHPLLCVARPLLPSSPVLSSPRRPSSPPRIAHPLLPASPVLSSHIVHIILPSSPVISFPRRPYSPPLSSPRRPPSPPFAARHLLPSLTILSRPLLP